MRANRGEGGGGVCYALQPPPSQFSQLNWVCAFFEWNTNRSRTQGQNFWQNQPVGEPLLNIDLFGIENNQKLTREKIYPTREKLSFFYPWKSNLTREKTSKTTRENLCLPVKFFGKLPVKNSSHPWKKPEKVEKSAFTGYFRFHGKKKHWKWQTLYI